MKESLARHQVMASRLVLEISEKTFVEGYDGTSDLSLHVGPDSVPRT